MERIKLIQHGELPKTRSISELQFMRTDFTPLFHLSQEICNTGGYCGLAMDQIPVIERYLGKGDYYRAIFLRSESNGGESSVRADTLVLNPKIELTGDEEYTQIEACGSIDFCESLMVVRRPTNFSLKGLFYTSDDKRPRYKEIVLENLKGFSAIQHEIDHLDGKTALDFPARLADPLSVMRKSELIRLMEQNGKNCVYFSKEGRIQKLSVEELRLL